jgi:hypothetical protein
MERIGGIKKKGIMTETGKCGGYFHRDETRLPHTGNNYLPLSLCK